MRRWVSVVISAAMCVAIAITSALPVAHAEDDESFPSEYLTPAMWVSRSSLSTKQIASAVRAAGAVEAISYVISFPFLPLTAHTRDGVDKLRLANGWRIPFATMVTPPEFIAAVGGEAMAAPLLRGEVLIGETSAKVRSAHVGDVITLRDRHFGVHTFVIGAIVPDLFVDEGDIAMSRESAAVFGLVPKDLVMFTGMSSASALVSALRNRGIQTDSKFRVHTSWALPNPDASIGTGIAKSIFGEFAYRPTAGSSIQVSADWANKNIVWKKVFRDIPIANNCHKITVAAIQGALTEIKKAGLARAIDVANSNRYGGCFVGRFNRLAGVYGSPSRHAWGMAFDINTNANPQGGIPKMNCAVVRIFRKWGFAWGGNFPWADGMHFEYVGTRRDQRGYPSIYCPNKVSVPTTTLPVFGATTTSSTTTTISSTTTSTTTAPTTTVAITSIT
ncbi:unannotated protein [freshwater metagenome]|uniref:Unannotated protein n=1 Tax=freshwater metagenome TaxID=449393 RepID=A0A6J6GD87_9ZZZZ|nr:hypothetical protein [Actinomycetota bacterium]